jgi:hypothetical protein
MSPNTTAQRNTSSNGTATQSNTQSSNSNQRMIIFSGGRRVTDFSQINIHHSGNSYTRRTNNGKEERFRADTNLLVKDFVLKDESGSTRVPVRSPVSGYVQKGHQEYTNSDGSKGGAGYYVDIYDKPSGTPGRKKIGRMFHLEDESPLEDGSYIVAGTAVGIQGNTGGSTGRHNHIETLPEVWEEYIRAIQTGDFSKLQNLEVNRDKRSGHVHADSTANVSNGTGQTSNSSGDSAVSNNTSGNSTLTTASDQTVQADLKKVVASMLKNAEQIKSASGIDVTNPKGLGQAVAIYWSVNNLELKTFTEQFPNISGDDITAALDSTSQANETPSVQPSVNNREYAT